LIISLSITNTSADDARMQHMRTHVLEHRPAPAADVMCHNI
jgi:hypothetical protein